MQHRIQRTWKGVGVVAAEVQAAAFVAALGAFNDQVGSQHEIAQFDQVVADAEIFIVFGDFTFQQLDTMLGAFKPFVGAHNADIIPHEAAQFGPVVRDHNHFVGVADAAFIPCRQRR